MSDVEYSSEAVTITPNREFAEVVYDLARKYTDDVKLYEAVRIK